MTRTFVLDKQDSVDEALIECRNSGDSIHLIAGEEFQTLGYAFFGRFQNRMLAASTKLLIGPGATLRLHKNAVGVSENDPRAVVLTAGCNAKVVGGEESVIDGNYQNNTTGACPSGVRFEDGGSWELSNVVIKGLRGKAGEIEVFGVSSSGSPEHASVSHVRVKDVCPNSYVSGIFPGASILGVGTTSVRHCSVDLGEGNWFGFSSNIVPKDSDVGCIFEHCISAGGVECGFHNDTGPTSVILKDFKSLNARWSDIRLACGNPNDIRRVVVSGFSVLGADLCIHIDRNCGPASVVVFKPTDVRGKRHGFIEGHPACSIAFDPATIKQRPFAPETRGNVQKPWLFT